MANRRPHDIHALGAAREGERRASAIVSPIAWRVAPAANDNKAPLIVRLQRLFFGLIAAAAIGWLFWVGLLR